MKDILVDFSGNLAADPKLFFDANPKKITALVTIMKDVGRRKADNSKITVTVPLAFQGEYALEAAYGMKKGTRISGHGVLRIQNKEKGVDATGKKVYETVARVYVRKFEYLGRSGKEYAEIINANIARAKAAGLIPAQVAIGADYLLQSTPREKRRPFNLQEVIATGKCGHASVWMPGQGWLGPKTATPAKTNAQIAADLAALQSAAPAPAAGAVNPFAGAAVK